MSRVVPFLLEILQKDRSSVIRHEAAAQLLKIEQKKPWVMSDMKDKVIAELLSVIINDKSLVARHESIEALSYIGDDTVLPLLNKIIKSESSDNEILDTLKIAKDIIEYRIIKNISPSQLSKTIIEEYN